MAMTNFQYSSMLVGLNYELRKKITFFDRERWDLGNMLVSLTQMQLSFLNTHIGHSVQFILHYNCSTWLTVDIQLILIKLGDLKIISEVDILILYHNLGATRHISPI